jgi:prepilin-type N-terminal cleavage/methylation domain-containing protein
MDSQSTYEERVSRHRGLKEHGFTLVEILIVMLLMSLIAFMTFPRLRLSTPTSDLRTSTRQFVGFIKYLRGLAATENRVYKLYFDLDENRYWVAYIEENGEEFVLTDDILGLHTLKEGVLIEEVNVPGKLKITEGQTSIIFYASGEVEGAEIVLSSSRKRLIRLRIHPLTGRCEAQWEDLED